MRARNVEALTELLREAEASPAGRSVVTDTDPSGAADPGRLAEWLVEAGAVLVPSAVTEQEAMDLLHRARTEVSATATELSQGPWFRESLSRLANGDAWGSRDEGWAVPRCLKGTHR